VRPAPLWALVATGCVIGSGDEASPVSLEPGAPRPVGFSTEAIDAVTRGRVDHEVCVAVDTAAGFVFVTQLIDPGGATAPRAGAAVQSTPHGDLDCPTGDDWRGWARIFWGTVTGRALVTLEHEVIRGPSPGAGDLGKIASGGQVVLDGVAFRGYAVAAAPAAPVSPGSSTLELALHVDYAATGPLDPAPAAGVDLVLSWVPAPPPVVGGSPGFDVGAGRLPTDAGGDAYLLVDGAGLCDAGIEYVLFVTTPDGGTALVTSLGCGVDP
jgi:hypothetical protein